MLKSRIGGQSTGQQHQRTAPTTAPTRASAGLATANTHGTTPSCRHRDGLLRCDRFPAIATQSPERTSPGLGGKAGLARVRLPAALSSYGLLSGSTAVGVRGDSRPTVPWPWATVNNGSRFPTKLLS